MIEYPSSIVQFPEMATIKRSAEMSGLPYDFIRNLCLNDKIHYVKSGKKFYVDLESLAAYLKGGD